MGGEAFLGIFVMILFFTGLVVSVFVAYLLWDGLSRIPKENRTVEPYFAWLTLIPLAGIAFLWILLPFKIPESLRSYFVNQQKGSGDSDYGKIYGLGVMISYSCMIIPLINTIAWLPAMVFLILYVIQFRTFTQELPPKVQSFSDTQPSSPSFVANPQGASRSNLDKYDQLEKLKKLLDEGVLSSEEFEEEKRKLLADN